MCDAALRATSSGGALRHDPASVRLALGPQVYHVIGVEDHVHDPLRLAAREGGRGLIILDIDACVDIAYFKMP